MSDMTVAELAEDHEACKRVAWLFLNEHTGNICDDAADMQAALRALANPAPEVPDEPTDPAVRVVDRDGDEWARRADGEWVCIGGGENSIEHAYPTCSWEGLASGKHSVVTPDPPKSLPEWCTCPDDCDCNGELVDPLKPGDLVRVMRGKWAGTYGEIYAFSSKNPQVAWLTLADESQIGVKRDRLALTGAVTPDPPNAADVQADADDDRPLRAGDRVRVADDAQSPLSPDYLSVAAGRVVTCVKPSIRADLRAPSWEVRADAHTMVTVRTCDLEPIGDDA